MTEKRDKTPWYTHNRRAQQAWKQRTATLPDAARAPGRTWVEVRGRRKRVGPFPVCLPEHLADHNLLAEVRGEAIARMAAHGIAWHAGEEAPDGTPWPSTHLLDSQVQCLNVMLSLAARPAALLRFVRQAEPEAVGLVPVEDGSPVAFEWIGLADHLGEGRGRPRQRGRYTTSVDAFLVVERADGGRTGLLVEWKFTESYPRPVAFRGPGGTDRRAIYRTMYEASARFRERPPIEAVDAAGMTVGQLTLPPGTPHQDRYGGPPRDVYSEDTEVHVAVTAPATASGRADMTLTVFWQGLLGGPVLHAGRADLQRAGAGEGRGVRRAAVPILPSGTVSCRARAPS